MATRGIGLPPSIVDEWRMRAISSSARPRLIFRGGSMLVKERVMEDSRLEPYPLSSKSKHEPFLFRPVEMLVAGKALTAAEGGVAARRVIGGEECMIGGGDDPWLRAFSRGTLD